MSGTAGIRVNSDCSELLSIFNEREVRYLIVGAHAFAYHAEPRFTKDFDVWVEPTRENASRVWKGLAAFGAPVGEVTPGDFAKPGTVFQIGVEPNRIDILTAIDGVRFPTAWENRARRVLGGVPVAYLGLRELIRNKRSVGRPKDLADLETLEEARRRRRRASRRS